MEDRVEVSDTLSGNFSKMLLSIAVLTLLAMETWAVMQSVSNGNRLAILENNVPLLTAERRAQVAELSEEIKNDQILNEREFGELRVIGQANRADIQSLRSELTGLQQAFQDHIKEDGLVRPSKGNDK